MKKAIRLPHRQPWFPVIIVLLCVDPSVHTKCYVWNPVERCAVTVAPST